MKKIGIIGGLGPESTLDYYKRITSFFQQHNQSFSTPEIIIYSVDMSELFAFVTDQRWQALADWLASKVTALKNAGAEFAVISSNTPHIVFDQLQPQAALPMISIVEATLEAAKSMGFKKIGLLGTGLTMQTNFFGERFSREGITVVVPNEQERSYIEEKLFSEIELGIFKEETRQGLLSIVQDMKTRDGIEAVILGCTELPLILDQKDSDVPFLNTTAIHVEAICRFCLQPS